MKMLTAAAEKTQVINRGVIPEASRLLNLNLQTANAFRAWFTPVSKVSPGQARPLQLCAVRTAEAHVVRSCVVPKDNRCLHAKRESHEEAAKGTPQRLAPRAPPVREGEMHWLCGCALPYLGILIYVLRDPSRLGLVAKVRRQGLPPTSQV